jgi:TIR domain-containing protein
MKVFITHSHGNRPLVRQVVKTLKQAGLDVWDDECDTDPGDNWAKVTGEALEQSDAMVVLITPDALDSTIVHRDVAFALTNIQFEYRVIPVLVGVEQSVAAKRFNWIIRNLELVIMPVSDGHQEGIDQITHALQSLKAVA